MRFLRKLFVRKPKPEDLRKLKPGQAGELWASYLYRKKGHRLLASNYEIFWKKKIGEIDLIFLDGRRIIMVEVKTRTSESFESLEETIHWRKQGYLRRMAKLYINEHPEYEGYDFQVDVIGVLMDEVDNSVRSVRIIENAIEDEI